MMWCRVEAYLKQNIADNLLFDLQTLIPFNFLAMSSKSTPTSPEGLSTPPLFANESELQRKGSTKSSHSAPSSPGPPTRMNKPLVEITPYMSKYGEKVTIPFSRAKSTESYTPKPKHRQRSSSIFSLNSLRSPDSPSGFTRYLQKTTESKHGERSLEHSDSFGKSALKSLDRSLNLLKSGSKYPTDVLSLPKLTPSFAERLEIFTKNESKSQERTSLLSRFASRSSDPGLTFSKFNKKIAKSTPASPEPLRAFNRFPQSSTLISKSPKNPLRSIKQTKYGRRSSLFSSSNNLNRLIDVFYPSDGFNLEDTHKLMDKVTGSD